MVSQHKTSKTRLWTNPKLFAFCHCSSSVTWTRLAPRLSRGKSRFSSWKLRGIHHITSYSVLTASYSSTSIRRTKWGNVLFIYTRHASFRQLEFLNCFDYDDEITESAMSHQPTDWYVIRLAHCCSFRQMW